MLDMSPERLDRLSPYVVPAAAAALDALTDAFESLPAADRDDAILLALGIGFSRVADKLQEDAVEVFEQVVEAFDDGALTTDEDALSPADNLLINSVEEALGIEF